MRHTCLTPAEDLSDGRRPRVRPSWDTASVLVRPHISIGAQRARLITKPDPQLLHDVVAQKVIDAMRVASQALSRAGVRHAVAGGLAVGANGYPRATRDVYFLVGNEAFEHHPRGLVTLRSGVPFQVNGVAIDFLSIGPDEEFLTKELGVAEAPFLAAAPLVYLKLKSSRLRDQADVIELVKASLDVDGCRRYLAAHAPDLLSRFDDLITRADAE